MHALELIRKKHAGVELSAEEISWLVRGAVARAIPDYQLSALLMAINFQHLSFAETVAFTRAYVESGTTLSWPGDQLYIDKHSTGGVGDKVSLILLPVLASMGFRVAKMSGRSLGHTGGTIDKLESIPGFRTKLSQDEMLRVVDEVGCCIVEQSADLVPADKLFYALRDATDTVNERGLIAASVMSKKIACGAPYILLDVKCGSGAFFKTREDADAFATTAIAIGSAFDRRVGAVISAMDQPLGQAVGNAIEVLEALRFFSALRKGVIGPWLRDIGKVVTALAARALHLTGQLDPDAKGVGIHWLMSLGLTDPDRIEATFRRWITAQGGDLAAFTERYKDYYAIGGMEIRARKDQTGYIDRIDAAALGRSLGALGAGREQADDVVDPEVGLLCHARLGSHVERGALLATLYPGRANPELASSIAREISAAFHFSADPPAHRRVILRTL